MVQLILFFFPRDICAERAFGQEDKGRLQLMVHAFHFGAFRAVDAVPGTLEVIDVSVLELATLDPYPRNFSAVRTARAAVAHRILELGDLRGFGRNVREGDLFPEGDVFGHRRWLRKLRGRQNAFLVDGLLVSLEQGHLSALFLTGD